MQLKKFRVEQTERLGLKHLGQWLDLSLLLAPLEPGNDMVRLLAQWSEWKPRIEQALAKLSELPLIPDHAQTVLPFQPLSLRDFMLSERHAVDAARGFVKNFMPKLLPALQAYEKLRHKTFPMLKPKTIWYRQPLYYFSNHLNLVTDGEVIDWPSYTRYLDYELELAFVLATPLRNATHAEALAAIGGFLVLNDFSARDVQLEEMRSGFGPQKSKHFVNGLSSTVATADELLSRVTNLQAEVRINGRTITTTSTAGMRYSIAEVLVHVSRDETLHAGEVFGLGTIPGGCALETGVWLKPGDELELWIEGVGTLRNRIARS